MSDHWNGGLDRRKLLTTLGGTISGAATVAHVGSASRGRTSDNWPTFQYEKGRSGYHPDAHGPKNNIVESWRTRRRGPNAPAVVNGLVYTGSRPGRITAYNARDGSKEWNTNIEGNIGASRPTVADGTVYHGDSEGYFYAFDAGTGEEEWRFATDGYINSGSVTANGLVYFESDDVVLAITQSDGNRIWSLETPWFLDMATDGDTVYIGTGDSKLRAVDANSGELLWIQTLGTDPRTITVVEDILYIGGSSYMAAVDASDGSPLWKFDSGFVTNSAAVAHGLVYFGDNRNQLYAVDKDTGTERWRFAVGEAQFDGINSSPAVVGNLVYFGSYDEHIYALNAFNGRERWSYDTGEAITGSPAVVNGHIHVGTRLSGLVTVASKSHP